MAAIGHHFLGDSLYGNISSLISRQALHSYKVSFIHPITKKNISIEIDLPDDMKKILNSNRNVQITIKMKYYLSSIRLEKVLEYDMKMLISTLGTNYVLLMIV